VGEINGFAVGFFDLDGLEVGDLVGTDVGVFVLGLAVGRREGFRVGDDVGEEEDGRKVGDGTLVVDGADVDCFVGEDVGKKVLLGATVEELLGNLEADVEVGNRMNLEVIFIFPNPRPHIPTRETTVDVRGIFNVAVKDVVDIP